MLIGHRLIHAGVDLSVFNYLYSPLSFFCCTKPLSFVYNTRWPFGGDGGRPSGYLRSSLLCTFNHGVQHIKSVLRDSTSAVLMRVVSAGGYRNGDVLYIHLNTSAPPERRAALAICRRSFYAGRSAVGLAACSRYEEIEPVRFLFGQSVTDLSGAERLGYQSTSFCV